MKCNYLVRRLQVLMGVSLATLSLVACSRSEFERQHDQAILGNPTGVRLEIHIRGGRKEFSVAEPVESEELYTSKFSGQWHIEILEGWNGPGSGAADLAHITDGKTIGLKLVNHLRPLFVATHVTSG